MGDFAAESPSVGAADLRLPDDLREPLLEHIAYLRERYLARGWGGRVGWGERPALLVIDLALAWTAGSGPLAGNLDAVVAATRRVLDAARGAGIPVFFTTAPIDPADPPGPSAARMRLAPAEQTPAQDGTVLDPRLGPLPGEKVLRKPYASAFKGTPFHEWLTGLRGYPYRHRLQHQPLRLCHLPRRQGQLSCDRAARSGRRALRVAARGQHARYRDRPG